jgi:predicted nucleic acid-binding protein
LKVVSDSSPIIAFSNLGKLYILKELFGRITIPQGVRDELSGGHPFRLEEWIDVVDVQDRSMYKMLRSSLDHGESEAIVLYFERNMELLLLAKRKGLIPSVGAELATLEKEGAFRLSQAVYRRLLNEAKE